MAVCLEARLVQSDFRAADKHTKYTRLVLGQGCAQRWRAQGAHKEAQGTHKAAHKVLFNLVQRLVAHKVYHHCPGNETHKVRTRSARIWLWNKDLGKLPYIYIYTHICSICIYVP